MTPSPAPPLPAVVPDPCLPANGWAFLDPSRFDRALKNLPNGGLVVSSSKPSQEEKDALAVLGGFGRQAQSGRRPPMGWYDEPADPSRPFALTRFAVAVLLRPDDGRALLLRFAQRNGETMEQLVHRCLLEAAPGITYDGKVLVGRLTASGDPQEPWCDVDNRLLAWERQARMDAGPRAALRALAEAVTQGAMPKAVQAWERQQLLIAIDPVHLDAPARPSPPRL